MNQGAKNRKGNSGAAIAAPLGVALLALGGIVPATARAHQPAAVRLPEVHRPTGARPVQSPAATAAALLPEIGPKPIDLLHHMVKANQAFSFVAREISANSNGSETEQWVRWDPKVGLRRESIRPDTGDILIDNFRSSWLYSQRDRLWTEQPSLLPRPNGRINEVLKSIKSGALRAEWVGQDIVAGRVADIVRVLPAVNGPAPTRRLWIDRATGIRLKSEDIGAGGRVLSTAYYLSVDLNPLLDPHDFEVPALPPGTPGVRVVETQRYRTVEEATRAGIAIRVPSFLPPGFTLRVVEAGGKNHQRVTQRYANGLTVVSLIASPTMPFGKKVAEQLGPSGSGFINGPRGLRAYLWRDAVTGTNFAVLSSLPDDQIKRIADSVR